MIPKIIHFIWVGPPMPAWGQRNIEEFRRLNPDYDVLIHGEEALHPDYAEICSRMQTADPCEKADLIRYSVLEKYGGWYFDVDYWPFRPVADAVRAWHLDGSRMFIAEAWPSKANPGWLGNGVLASTADHPLWPRIRELARETPHENRLSHGPRMIRRIYEANPEAFVVAAECWFNGPKPAVSSKLYHRLLSGASPEFMRCFDDRTAGQLPFAMHLWAWKYESELSQAQAPAPYAAVMVLPGYKRNNPASVFTAVARGLSACGYSVDYLPFAANALAHVRQIPDLLVTWNGQRQPVCDVVREARRMGCKTLFIEYGFWNRARHMQVDAEGNQHRASWSSRLREAAPPEGAERLARFYPDGVSPMRARRKDYVLVLGQVPRDSQLGDSEIQGPLPLQRSVKGALPAGLPVYFRPHPQCSNVRLPANKRILPTLSDDPAEARTYRISKSGSGLAAALAGARFVVTINSTAGNEALAAGVPVLAFGPALYTLAGVARQTTLKTIKEDLAVMLNGWAPEQAAVENYLQWLAARQWTAEELAQGDVLRSILSGVNVEALRHVA